MSLVAFREALVGAGLLVPTAERGVFARSGVFEGVVVAFERAIQEMDSPSSAEQLHFPPVFARADYCCLNHAHHFPDLMGSVHTFTGGGPEHAALVRQLEAGEDWSRGLAASGVMLVPAACYPLYPTARGTLPPEGRTVDIAGWVFRREPSDDPHRMQAFRQRERVRLGTAEQALSFRDAGVERYAGLLRALGLPVEKVVANDPFFGRGGRLAAATQREQELKFELVVPFGERVVAVASANYHLDTFGVAFGIRSASGASAHTACHGFGLERVALALFWHHGLDPAAWPERVRGVLGFEA